MSWEAGSPSTLSSCLRSCHLGKKRLAWSSSLARSWVGAGEGLGWGALVSFSESFFFRMEERPLRELLWAWERSLSWVESFKDKGFSKEDL